jgi:Zn-dependent protease with chaperone function
MTRQIITAAMALTLAIPALARKPGEPLKPGFNLFSKQQDVQLGQQAASEVRKQYQVVQNQELQDYIRRIGERLAATPSAKESGFQFTYTLVSDKSINAFALPGGPTFVHTGLIVAADNEAQVAGVLAHEISHVILRHGTNQASKANLVQIPAILAGAVTGSNLLAQLTNLVGTGFMLKFSRTDESQADALGTRIMSDAGYNPIEMARFFEKLEAQGGSRAPELLSDHPNPGNRVNAVQEEIRGLPQRSYGTTVGDFARMKSLVAQLPAPPPKQNPLRGSGASAPSPSSRPSGGFKQLRGREFALSYPDNWEVFGDNDSATVTIAPREGIVQTSNGGGAIGYGAIVRYYFPESQPRDVKQATDELIQHLHGGNPSLRVVSGGRRVTVDGSQGLVTTLSNNSPYQGQVETDVLLSALRPQGLFYMIFIAPQSDFRNLQSTFDEMVRSIRFSN